MRESLVYRRRLERGERLAGLGDRVSPLDRRGREFTLWNRDSPACALGRDPTYKSIPVLFGYGAGRAWGVFVDSAARLRFDCRGDELRVTGPPGTPVEEVEAESPAEALAAMSMILGRAPLPPRWALGFHQSRWGYRTQEEVLAVARGFHARGIPLDAVHLDIDYMDGYRVFTWNRERFPDPAGLIEELRALGARTVAIVDPGVKVDPGYRVYEELLERGHACLAADGRPWVGRVWPGRCVFPDFMSEEARAWWAEQHRGLVAAGVEGIWTDMNEPAVHRFDTMPGDVRHAAGPHAAVHNAYGHLMARATHEGLLRVRPGRRPFVLTRSAWAGTQRYAATWTGDNSSRWSHLRNALRMSLGLGLSGQPFSGSDVGGFVGRCSPELYVRWMQLGAFTPFYRVHSAKPPLALGRREPWAFGPEAEALARAAIELRHRLVPYTYTAFWRHRETGLPVMRPLLLHWPDDPRAAGCDDAFLWGDSLLVAPVLTRRARRRAVDLPAGEWYDFWSGERIRGPATIAADAPLERVPLYVRAGTVLPFSGGELRVYPGRGTSWLYEDDGESPGGAATVTTFTVDGDAVSTERAGSFPSAFAGTCLEPVRPVRSRGPRREE